MKNLKRKELVKTAAFVLLVALFLMVGHALHLEERVSIESVREALTKTGGWQYVLFALLYCIAALIPFPTAILSSASGALWGAYIGTGMTVLSATMASCLPFVLARIMARSAARKMMEGHSGASRCDRFAGRNGFAAVLVMRLIPIFPWDMVNYLSGLCSIRFRDYFLASLIGTIPASFTYNLMGASLGGSVDKTAVFAVAFLSLAIASIFLIRQRKVGHRKTAPVKKAQHEV